MPADDVVEDDDVVAENEPSGVLARVEEMDTERWAESIVTGAITYVVGYLVVAAFFFVGPANPGEELSLMEQLGKVGVTFNAAHYVDANSSEFVLVVADGQATELGLTYSLFRLSDLLGAEQAIPRSLYLAVPVVLLLTVGFSRAWRLTPTDDLWDPVKTTLGFPIGYGAVAYLGTYLFSYPIGRFTAIADVALVTTKGAVSGLVTEGDTTRVLVANSTQAVEIQGRTQAELVTVTLSPDPLLALLMGIAYPLAFATMGALLAVSLRQRTDDRDEEDDASGE